MEGRLEGGGEEEGEEEEGLVFHHKKGLAANAAMPKRNAAPEAMSIWVSRIFTQEKLVP